MPGGGRAALDGLGRRRYDNAMAESFLSTLECELLNRRRFRSQAEARMAIFSDIEGVSQSPAPARGAGLQVSHHLRTGARPSHRHQPVILQAPKPSTETGQFHRLNRRAGSRDRAGIACSPSRSRGHSRRPRRGRTLGRGRAGCHGAERRGGPRRPGPTQARGRPLGRGARDRGRWSACPRPSSASIGAAPSPVAGVCPAARGTSGGPTPTAGSDDSAGLSPNDPGKPRLSRGR